MSRMHNNNLKCKNMDVTARRMLTFSWLNFTFMLLFTNCAVARVLEAVLAVETDRTLWITVKFLALPGG